MAKNEHRFRFRLQSGDGTSELERLACKEISAYTANSDRQRFLRDCFMQGYALYRAGIVGDSSALGMLSMPQVKEEVVGVAKPGSTVNKEARQELGGLFDEDAL